MTAPEVRPSRLAASAFVCRICEHSVEYVTTCGRVDDCDHALDARPHFHCDECTGGCSWGGCQGVRKHDTRAVAQQTIDVSSFVPERSVRRWANDEPEPIVPPRVVISSRDGADVPPVRNAVKLATLAQAHGWTARQTLALAEVPERHYRNGNLAKAAHQLWSVAVRLRREAVGAFAVWHRENEGAWRFDCAQVGLTSCGLAEILRAVAE